MISIFYSTNDIHETQCLIDLIFSISIKKENILFIFFQVEKNADPTTLHRTPDPSTFPSAPGTPKIVNITESSVVLIWGKGPERPGSSPLIGYTVEYFSSDLQTGWVVAAHRVPAQTITVSISFFKFKTF